MRTPSTDTSEVFPCLSLGRTEVRYPSRPGVPETRTLLSGLEPSRFENFTPGRERTHRPPVYLPAPTLVCRISNTDFSRDPDLKFLERVQRIGEGKVEEETFTSLVDGVLKSPYNYIALR